MVLIILFERALPILKIIFILKYGSFLCEQNNDNYIKIDDFLNSLYNLFPKI